LIDPRLRDDATLLVAARGPGLSFDRYRAVDVELRDEAFGGEGPLPADGRGRATQQQRMTLRVIGGEHDWQVECVVQRRVPPDADFAAAADEREVPVEYDVELQVWYQLWKFVRRTLPTPLVQIRGEGGTKAAMIFGQPERVWFDRGLEAHDGEVLLVTLIALRLLPIGLET
jgi:hypothetical protein